MVRTLKPHVVPYLCTERQTHLMLMWLSLTIIEAEVSFAYALEAAPLRVAMATTREKNFIIILILLTCVGVDRLVYGMKEVQGQGGKTRGKIANQ